MGNPMLNSFSGLKFGVSEKFDPLKTVANQDALKVVKEGYVKLNPEMLDKIELFKVKDGSLSSELRLSATVEAASSKTGYVNSLVHGVVTKVLVEVGDRVKAGQPLVYINCPELASAETEYFEADAHRLEVQSNLKLVETRVTLANSELERARMLNKEGIAALKDVQLAASRLASVQAERQSASALVGVNESKINAALSRLRSFGLKVSEISAKTMSSELILRAPIGGVVSERFVQPGQSVGPNLSGSSTAQSLLVVNDFSTVWVMLEVPQSQISALKLGAPIKFSLEGPSSRNFVGIVTRLGEKLDPVTRTASVRTEVANPDRFLKPGMMVVTSVKIRQGRGDSLVIPTKAIQKSGSKSIVFRRFDEYSFEAVPVTILERGNNVAEIGSGLERGDCIVSRGSFFLKSELMRATISGED